MQYCYINVTCTVLLNRLHSKLGQHCTVRCLILTRSDNRSRICLALHCAKHTPLNKGESRHLFRLIYRLEEYSQSLLWMSNIRCWLGIGYQRVTGGGVKRAQICVKLLGNDPYGSLFWRAKCTNVKLGRRVIFTFFSHSEKQIYWCPHLN